MKLQKILFQSFSMLFVMIAAYVMPSCSSSDDIGGRTLRLLKSSNKVNGSVVTYLQVLEAMTMPGSILRPTRFILHLIMLASLIGCKGTMTRISETPVIMTMMASLILLMEKG